MKPSNTRIAKIAYQSGNFGNLYGGGDSANRASFVQGKHLPGPVNSRMGNMSGPQGAAQSSSISPIRITIQNTDSLTLVAPVFSAGEQLVVPFNGTADITGAVSTATKGIILNYIIASGIAGQSNTAFIRNRITQQPFYVTQANYAFGTVSGQINQFWTIRSLMSDGSGSNAPYYPDQDLLLGQQVQDRIQTSAFQMFVDYTKTLLIPILPLNTVTITFYLGSDIDPKQVAQGMPAVTGFQVPNVASPALGAL